ncbi:MAG: adenylate/guanylate cyclase domain-containing protein [Cyanobacteriota bacterium]|nr:adenylate/guanylate cyclase domain-containing protein [Cyanobacteriota bacterium]
MKWLSRKTGNELESLELLVTIASSAIVALLVLGLAKFRGFEQLELLAFDQMIRWRAYTHTDTRSLIVEITEDDLQKLNWPLDDRTLARLLARLQGARPHAIGLDIYRDIPVGSGYEKLVEALNAPNIVGITKIGDFDAEGVSPPPTLPPEQIGFNDIILDTDNIVRRNLLFSETAEGTLSSFSLQLATVYLTSQGIAPEASPSNPNFLQLGRAVFVPLQSDSGGYTNLDSRGYQTLLDYRSLTTDIPRVTVSEVLNGEIDPKAIENKLVFIGSTAPSLRDTFATPYSAGDPEAAKIPGVVVHAQMTAQIVNAALGEKPLFRFFPAWAEGVWIFCWASVSGLIVWKVRHPILLAGCIAIVIGALCLVSFFIFQQQIWVPVVAPAMAVALAGTAGIAYRAYRSQRQHAIVMKLLGQNTSPEIATALWNHRTELLHAGKLQGSKLTATMLFTDIKDFSTISEQMPPEKLLEWLNEYLSALTEEVQLYRGIINKFTGDGIMAVFGVPVRRTTGEEIDRDAFQAVTCGLALGERLKQLNQDWQQRGLPVIQMRVGIFTGPVVAGSLGGKERMEYGIIGDSVNIASRLESCHKERQASICRVLVAQQTLDRLGGQFRVEPWGRLMLKGKQQSIEVYRILDRLSENSSDNSTDRSTESSTLRAIPVANAIVSRSSEI